MLHPISLAARIILGVGPWKVRWFNNSGGEALPRLTALAIDAIASSSWTRRSRCLIE